MKIQVKASDKAVTILSFIIAVVLTFWVFVFSQYDSSAWIAFCAGVLVGGAYLTFMLDVWVDKIEA